MSSAVELRSFNIGRRISKRFSLVILLYINSLILYGQRSCNEIAVYSEYKARELFEDEDGKCTDPIANRTNQPDQMHRVIILTFYLAVLIGQIPVGYMCDMYGPKQVLIFGTLMSTLMILVIPIALNLENSYLLIILQIFFGWGQSVHFPCLCSFLSRWIPPNEQTRFIAGFYNVQVLCVPISRLIAVYFIALSEQSMYQFYVWVVLAIFWSLFFSVLSFNMPEEHPRITPHEKAFLRQKITKKVFKKQPVRKLLSDHGVWAMIAIGVVSDQWIYYDKLVLSTSNVGYQMRLSQLTLHVYHIYYGLVLMVSGHLWGLLWEYLIYKKRMKVVCVRIMSAVISQILQSIFYYVGYTLKCEQRDHLLWVLLLAYFFKSMYSHGVGVLDMTVNHAGLLAGYSVVMSYLSYLAIEFKTHADANDPQSVKIALNRLMIYSWIGIIFYAFFAVGDRRKWDYTVFERMQMHKTSNTYDWSCFEKPERESSVYFEMDMERTRHTLYDTNDQ